jgi:hypothetical protein
MDEMAQDPVQWLASVLAMLNPATKGDTFS